MAVEVRRSQRVLRQGLWSALSNTLACCLSNFISIVNYSTAFLNLGGPPKICSVNPPFLDLLHTSGLAFEVMDRSGNSLHCSLIPARLPCTPPTFTEQLSKDLLDSNPLVFLQLMALK